MALRETSPWAREPIYHDHSLEERFYGPRAPALLPEDPSAPDARVAVASSTRLGVLAGAQYDAPDLWWVLADANDVVDPFSLEVGAELRIPALDRVLLEVLT